jgi:K(+)-stimulated pyrophosphate-energized sodium pump
LPLKAEYKVLALFGLIAGAFRFTRSTSGNSSPIIVIAFLIGAVFRRRRFTKIATALTCALAQAVKTSLSTSPNVSVFAAR